MNLSTRILPLLTAVSVICTLTLPPSVLAAPATPSQTTQSEEQAFKALVSDAYLYAYPLVTMDVTMRQAVNTPDATSIPRRAPVNQFAHYRAYPDAEAKEVVRFNFDTLYSLAWLDTAKEPVILSLPDSKGRYYLAPLMDMWTDVFAVPGTRTTGNQAGHYAITAPDWEGKLPDGVEQIKAPTSVVWLLTRTQTNGPADYANVHAFQDQLKLTPLSAWGSDYTPPTGLPVRKDPNDQIAPQKLVNSMDGVQLLTRFAELLKVYPPHANDYPILHRLRALGIEPGKDFDTSRFSPAQLEIIRGVAKSSQEDIVKAISNASIGKVKNGWNWADDLGVYGTRYRTRALVALAGLGANLPEDAIYPNGFADADGKPYSGQNNYVLHFDKSQLPPADAFWSLTMYDNMGFQIANPINRFALSSHDKLTYNSDGSLDLYLQHAAPGKDKESNWLPAPEGNFQLTLRLYSPRAEVLRGEWVPQAARKTN